MTSNMQACERCGCVLVPGGVFCGQCGAPVTRRPEAPPPAEAPWSPPTPQPSPGQADYGSWMSAPTAPTPPPEPPSQFSFGSLMNALADPAPADQAPVPVDPAPPGTPPNPVGSGFGPPPRRGNGGLITAVPGISHVDPTPPSQPDPPIGQPARPGGQGAYFGPLAPEPAVSPAAAPAPAPAPVPVPRPAPAPAPLIGLIPNSPVIDQDQAIALVFDNGLNVKVTGYGVVGRQPEAKPGQNAVHVLPIDDPAKSVSKTHLEFGLDGQAFWVRDRGSTNGSRLEDPSGTTTELAPGQQVFAQVGSTIRYGGRSFQVRAVPR